MNPVSVLIVDDSPLMRKLLADMIARDHSLTVAGEAGNGHQALDALTRCLPDVVLLDVEMPEMDGLQTLEAIRRRFPALPVVMFSRFTRRGAEITIEALLKGATDYLEKPANGSLETNQQRIAAEVLPKLRLLGQTSPERKEQRSSLPGQIPRPALRAGIVAIASSTGGPQALERLLSSLPAEFPLPIVIVQHMPALFISLLAQSLTRQTPFEVREAYAGAALAPGPVWLAPGDRHLALEGQAGQITMQLQKTPPVNACRPSADILFSSVAECYGQQALAVVLTGMGQDGLQGCRSIRQAGGHVLAQDKASSVVWGMPGAVAQASLAQAVLPLGALGTAILAYAGDRQ